MTGRDGIGWESWGWRGLVMARSVTCSRWKRQHVTLLALATRAADGSRKSHNLDEIWDLSDSISGGVG